MFIFSFARAMGRKDIILIFLSDFYKSEVEYVFIPLLIAGMSHFMNRLLPIVLLNYSSFYY